MLTYLKKLIDRNKFSDQWGYTTPDALIKSITNYSLKYGREVALQELGILEKFSHLRPQDEKDDRYEHKFIQGLVKNRVLLPTDFYRGTYSYKDYDIASYLLNSSKPDNTEIWQSHAKLKPGLWQSPLSYVDRHLAENTPSIRSDQGALWLKLLFILDVTNRPREDDMHKQNCTKIPSRYIYFLKGDQTLFNITPSDIADLPQFLDKYQIEITKVLDNLLSDSLYYQKHMGIYEPEMLHFKPEYLKFAVQQGWCSAQNLHEFLTYAGDTSYNYSSTLKDWCESEYIFSDDDNVIFTEGFASQIERAILAKQVDFVAPPTKRKAL